MPYVSSIPGKIDAIELARHGTSQLYPVPPPDVMDEIEKVANGDSFIRSNIIRFYHEAMDHLEMEEWRDVTIQRKIIMSIVEQVGEAKDSFPPSQFKGLLRRSSVLNVVQVGGDWQVSIGMF